MIESPTFKLADIVLGGKLRQILRSYVRKGYTGEQIARELYFRTDGEIDITGQTMRKWVRELGLIPPQREAV